nr:peroxidase-related enzyme [Saprospiraceae bacterium]
MSKIKTISYEESSGRLKEIYDSLIYSRGKLAEVHKIQSLRPESIVRHMELYKEIMFSKSDLSRATREMLAVVVSVCNGCVYCQKHHSSTLNFFWKDSQRIENLIRDFSTAGLSDLELELCKFSVDLTNTPSLMPESHSVEKLIELGMRDTSVLDATLVISYFNFVNRMVLALGVELEKDNGSGYHAEYK